MFLQSIDHVQVAAEPGCEEQARAFYAGLLGLQELHRPAAIEKKGGCWFAMANGQQLHVGIESPHAPARKAHPCFAVERYDEFRNQLLDAGREVLDDSDIPGVRRFFSYDPFGNRLEFVERAPPVR